MNFCISGYVNANGGGIDILARYKSGSRTSITIFELKDECTKEECPEEAIAQAIAYATFIRQLLRTLDANTDKWWRFFGLKSPLGNTLKIRAVIAMPVRKFNDTSFAGKRLSLPAIASYNDDCIELHYMYFNVNISKEISY